MEKEEVQERNENCTNPCLSLSFVRPYLSSTTIPDSVEPTKLSQSPECDKVIVRTKLQYIKSAIVVVAIFLGVAAHAGLRLCGDVLGISPSMGGLVSLAGAMIFLMGGLLIVKALGSESIDEDS